MRINQNGATIVVVVSVMATLAIFAGAALDYTMTVSQNVERSNKLLQETAIANGCLQKQFMYWREVCRGNTLNGPSASAFSGVPLPTSADFPNVSNFTATAGTGSSYAVSNYAIQALTPQLQPISSASTAPLPGVGTSGSNVTYYYRGTVTVSLPDRGPNVVLNASQIFEKQYNNPWQWAVFFNDPLEMQVGPTFTVDGWVQTNSSLWTGSPSLSFGDKVTYGTTWTIGFMPNDGEHASQTPGPPTWPANQPPSQGAPTTNPFGLYANVLNATTDNNAGYHELIEIPDPNNYDPIASARFFNNAGVKVLLNSSGSTITATVYDNTVAPYVSGGTTILGNVIGTIKYTTGGGAVPSTTGSSGYQKALFSTISSALTFNQSIQDPRQAATIALTELNIGTITTALASGGTLNGYAASFNPVIYITDQSANATTNQRAIELTNASVLPTSGLTAVSANPIYIQGDYNTGASPPSDSGNTSQPMASGYAWRPASVIADAVDVLSNSWTNSESTEGMYSRVASSTTINAAIMAGIVPTGTGGNNYSGGAEDFPRLIEDWGNGKGATLTYYGSMVELYDSEQATQPWSLTYYRPPLRNWHYDTGFKAQSPPGTIMVISYTRGQWYQQ